MPDTGAPWNIPYVEAADLVSDWPADSLALANAIDAGLDAAGGLVDVKSALFTGTQSQSTAGGANFAVTDLSITHEVADPSNKLVLMYSVGAAASSDDYASLGAYVAVDGSAIAVGDTAGNRPVIGSGGSTTGSGDVLTVRMLTQQFVYAPGAGSKTYTVRVKNTESSTLTLYVNRTEVDDDDARRRVRAASSLVLMEVKV